MHFETPENCDPIGYAWLARHLQVWVPRPVQLSYVRHYGAPFDARDGDFVTRVFARSMWPGDAPERAE